MKSEEQALIEEYHQKVSINLDRDTEQFILHAYQKGREDALEEVEGVFKKSFVTTDVYLVDRFRKKLASLKENK